MVAGVVVVDEVIRYLSQTTILDLFCIVRLKDVVYTNAPID